MSAVKVGDAFPISKEAWEAYRSVYRNIGQRHRVIDRLRHDLKWTICESVVSPWLAVERAKLVAKAGNA